MHVGILIIGSLLWDNCQRDAWRRLRLRIDRGVHVRVPIYYGRRSSSRGNTFTMALGTGDALGEAVLIPCASTISCLADLVAEAEALWKAEQPTAAANSICASWGSVGVLFAPTVPAEWRTGWKARFRSHASPVTLVDDAGTLRIAWPNTTDLKPADVDMILATVTKAQATQPSVTKIVDAWINQNQGHERYFFENVRHGIRTPADNCIWRQIEEHRPRWLREGAYAEAIALLRAAAT